MSALCPACIAVTIATAFQRARWRQARKTRPWTKKRPQNANHLVEATAPKVRESHEQCGERRRVLAHQRRPFGREALNQLLDLGDIGIRQLITLQRGLLRDLLPNGK